MKFKDYELADCRLFEDPPVRIGDVLDTFEEVMVATWERGRSVDYAINAFMGDESNYAEVIAAVSPNLEFQRGIELGAAEREENAELESIALEEGRKDEIEATVGEVVQERRKQYQATKEDHYATRVSHDRAREELNRMRRRIKETVQEIGGVKGYELLTEIHKSVEVAARKSTPYKKADKPYKGKPSLEVELDQEADPFPEDTNSIDKMILAEIREKKFEKVENPDNLPVLRKTYWSWLNPVIKFFSYLNPVRYFRK